MIYSFLFKAYETLLPRVIHHYEFISTGNPDVTAEVPFSPLEKLPSTCVKAAQADDVGVDMSH